MNILFVCTGNTCRSPLAEALGRREAIARGLMDVEVTSAGTAASAGSGASDGSMLVGLERHLDLGAHRARQLTADLIAAADLVLVMSAHHLERAESLGGDGKTFLLSAFADPESGPVPIGDPFGGELTVYRATADQLHDYVRRAFDRLTQT